MLPLAQIVWCPLFTQCDCLSYICFTRKQFAFKRCGVECRLIRASLNLSGERILNSFKKGCSIALT